VDISSDLQNFVVRFLTKLCDEDDDADDSFLLLLLLDVLELELELELELLLDELLLELESVTFL